MPKVAGCRAGLSSGIQVLKKEELYFHVLLKLDSRHRGNEFFCAQQNFLGHPYSFALICVHSRFAMIDRLSVETAEDD